MSTYQANKLLVARAAGDGLSMLVHLRAAHGAGGGCPPADDCAWPDLNFHRAPTSPQVEPAGQRDTCFVPRSCHVTGDIRCTNSPGPATSCGSSTPASRAVFPRPHYSFVPRWQPPFITAPAPTIAATSAASPWCQSPQYVTALGDGHAGGWRANKPPGVPDGCEQQRSSPRVVDAALAAARRPAVAAGIRHRRLVVDTAWEIGRRLSKCLVSRPCPAGPYAFIGLSKIRKTSAMDGVPLAERRDELKCGVAAVDLRSGQVIGFLEFQTAVEEIFDVQLLPGLRFPEILGFQKDAIHNTFIVPSQGDGREAKT